MIFGPSGTRKRTRTRTRNLAETTSVRVLQEDEDRPTSSNFDISIEVLNSYNGRAPVPAGSATPIGTTAAATTTLVISIVRASVVSAALLP